MQLANNYQLGMEISNGDIGFIKEFDETHKEILIDFYGDWFVILQGDGQPVALLRGHDSQEPRAASLNCNSPHDDAPLSDA